jgi:glycosyltransferase involved in cell wall biosynthesis
MEISSSSIALLISIYFPPEPGGGSTLAWNRAMVLHKTGYSVFVICGFPGYPSGKVSNPKYKGKFFYVENMEPFILVRLRLLSIKHVGYVRRLVLFLNFIFLSIFYMPKILRIVGKIGIVYSLSPIIFSSVSGFVYSKITKSFFIFDVPDLWPEELVVFRTYLSPIIMRLGKVVAKLSYRVPDIIVTVSGLAAEYISKEYRPKASVYAIPTGIDPSKFPRLSKDDSRVDLIKKKILPEHLRNKFIILYAGLLSNAQGMENLAYAAEKLRDEEKIAILIFGEGEEKQKLEELKLEYSLNNFYLLPYQPRDIMPTIISAADVCSVLLSPEPIFDIALPTKFYEYLACCKPIIGVCKGELASIINSNNIGHTVNPGDIDKLVAIIKDMKNSPDSLQIMENNSYTTLQRFSLDSISSKFVDILKKEMM